MKKNKYVHLSIIGIFCSLYFLVATISMINSVAFFDLAHTGLMNWALAIGFELGAAASLAGIIILEKTNRAMVWGLFLLLTSFQMMANSYHAYINLEDYMGWIELFGLQEEEPIFQKRVLSVISGAVLPIVALGFIKSLVDYIRPEKEKGLSQEDVDRYYEERNKILTEKVEEENRKREVEAKRKREVEATTVEEKEITVPPLTVEKPVEVEESKAERVKAPTPQPTGISEGDGSRVVQRRVDNGNDKDDENGVSGSTYDRV